MAPKQKLKKVTRKRREKKLVERGAAHIRSSFNNTIVTLTEREDFEDGSIPLQLSYEPGNFQQDEDPHYDLITIYDGSISIQELEKEPALTRLKRRIKEQNQQQ